MDRWLEAALDYIPEWLAYQMQAWERPGCIAAIAHRGRIVYEQAFGYADAVRGDRLTPRHRFRIASHSKSFTAAGVLRLREAGRLKLDDAIGQHVTGLHPKLAAVTIAQILSHSAGIRRDMPDAGYFVDRVPFPSERALRAALADRPMVIEPNTRLKYSNIGYSLLGLLIEAVTGERYADWMRREVIAAAGLRETVPDMPLPPRTPMARGHSGKVLLGRRVVIPCDQEEYAFAPAGGFVSTAADVALFFDQLAPAARKSILSPASRREMVRRHWRNPHASQEGYYGLGLISGRLDGWDGFGHSGGLQGFISRTVHLPEPALTISILTNSLDGLAGPWVDGAISILQAYARRGAPARRIAHWRGRWSSLWGTVDLLPMGNRVLMSVPGAWTPLLDASEIAPRGRDHGRFVLANGYASHGEPVRLLRNARGKIVAVQTAGTKLLPPAKVAAEMVARYEKKRGVKAKR